ncbi:MAG: ACT domain-containing protein [Candidatus Micrarchaeota archaeon]
MRSVTILAPDREGLLADISYVLGKSNINIESLNVDVLGNRAIISILVKDQKRATTVLQQNGFETAENSPLVIKVPNNPEALPQIVARLDQQKVHVEELLMLGNDSSIGIFAINVDKPRKAVKILNDVLINPNIATLQFQ